MQNTAPRSAPPILELIRADCLDVMRDLPDQSIDLICADLPYCVTAMDWDRPINMEALWKEFRRIVTPRGVIVCHAVQPFTTDLINAARDLFRYSIVWQKSSVTHFTHANARPLCQHEDILIFSPSKLHTMTYNPVGAEEDKVRAVRMNNPRSYNKDAGQRAGRLYMAKKNYPRSIQRHDNSGKHFHAAQKPESLMEWIVQAYSNVGDIVLDPTMGSGTTGVAALRHGREFIGIEQNIEFFEYASKRISG